uniref:CUB domain-containing protein n=1 Tax=Meloidogyne incognita TaxID=6306 RepID=A0A914NQE9_MELIC
MVLTATLGPSKGCGGPLKAVENEWKKLNVPIDPQTENYYPNLRCEWNIEAERGNLIEIRLIELKLEQKPPQQEQQQNSVNSTLANYAEFRAIKSDCGGAFLAGQECCRWFLYTEKQQPLEVIFEQFSFPSTSGNCLDEFLELRDVGALSECQRSCLCYRAITRKKRKNYTYMWR